MNESLESLLFSLCESFVNALEFPVEEMIPFEVEVVFLLPSALLDAAVESFEVRILNVGASILHDHDESYQEGTLTD